MFVQFTFGNFKSFRDVQTFTMEAAPLRTNDNGLNEDNVLQFDNVRLLKSKAIYGSNASGKSNLAKAVSAFIYMVSRSVVTEDAPSLVWGDRFRRLNDWDDQPMFFQYCFLLENVIYRYGFEILQGQISGEWLFSGAKSNEIKYFFRSGENLEIIPDAFPASEVFLSNAVEGDNELYRKDSLLLTAGALAGNKFLGKIRDEIRFILGVDGGYEGSSLGFAMNKLVNGTAFEKQAIVGLLKAADTGIEDIDIEELSEEADAGTSHTPKKRYRLLSTHSVFNEEGEVIDKFTVPFLGWESDGTAKLLGIGALILDALKFGRTILIDEFDARLHPNLTLKIVELMNNSDINPKNAQLIFITHDAGLIKRGHLRRDQICIVEKDAWGISSLSDLIQFKGVRKDASYDKEYLNGSYAGVPFLDKMDWVINENFDDGLQKAQQAES